MPRTRHDAKAYRDAGGERHRIERKRHERAQETRVPRARHAARGSAADVRPSPKHGRGHRL